jgi:hypothetical protein
VYNRKREVIASAITNLDIHDLGRLAATYGLGRVYLISPLEDQRALARRIINHWVGGQGGKLNPDREIALKKVGIASELEEAIGDIEQNEGARPRVIATGARPLEGALGYDQARCIIRSGGPTLFLFGTAWGLASEIIQKADYCLSPIQGRTGYNHLSVRSAAAIILDRLLS